jgi:hypothetical protein
MITRWFKRSIAELLTLGKSDNPRNINNTAVSYDPNILVKSYLSIVSIQLGRGITDPTPDNYSLEIPQYEITDLDITVSEENSNVIITITGSLYAESNTYINEIGLIGLFKGQKVLFDRTKVEPQITLSTGQTLLISYKLII